MLSMVVDFGRVVLSVWLLAHQLRIDAFRQDSVGKKYTEKRLKSTVQFEIYKTWLDGNHTFKGTINQILTFPGSIYFFLWCVLGPHVNSFLIFQGLQAPVWHLAMVWW